MRHALRAGSWRPAAGWRSTGGCCRPGWAGQRLRPALTCCKRGTRCMPPAAGPGRGRIGASRGRAWLGAGVPRDLRGVRDDGQAREVCAMPGWPPGATTRGPAAAGQLGRRASGSGVALQGLLPAALNSCLFALLRAPHRASQSPLICSRCPDPRPRRPAAHTQHHPSCSAHGPGCSAARHGPEFEAGSSGSSGQRPQDHAPGPWLNGLSHVACIRRVWAALYHHPGERPAPIACHAPSGAREGTRGAPARSPRPRHPPSRHPCPRHPGRNKAPSRACAARRPSRPTSWPARPCPARCAPPWAPRAWTRCCRARTAT
jgi:hypothetical protein